MRFLRPEQLVWAAAVLVPLLLYLVRRRPRTVEITTLPFFKSLSRAYQESSWLRRLKRILSLLLTLLILAAAVGALARAVVSPGPGTLAGLVILVDRSGSMAAVDDNGRTRLDEAMQLVRRRLAGIPAAVPVSVIAYDAQPEVLLPLSHERRRIERVLARIRARPAEGDSIGAMQLARLVARLADPTVIWHVTDMPGTDKAVEQQSENGQDKRIQVDQICVALPDPVNAGITAFDLRVLPLQRGRVEAFVEVEGTTPEPLDIQLDVYMDGVLTSVRTMTLTTGHRERLLIPVDASRVEVLSLVLNAPDDALRADNELHARLPATDPIDVVWVAADPDPFTGLALSTLGNEGMVRVYQTGPEGWPPKDPVNAVIFDGWLPAQWPDIPGVVVICPPGESGPVHAVPLDNGLQVDRLRVVNERHPLLYGVASGRVVVMQTAAVLADDPWDPLWVGPAGPVLATAETGGQRVVLMAFAPQRSELLPLMASYPLLIGNAIYWTTEPWTVTRRGNNLRTGELVDLAGETVTWTRPTTEDRYTEPIPSLRKWTRLDRIGLWETDTGQLGSAAMLSDRETVLPNVSIDSAERTGKNIYGNTFFGLAGDLSPMLLWFMFILLLTENWLFHRHSVF